MNNPSEPPKLGTFLLRKIYGEEMFDEIYGDLRELYIEQLESGGKLYAQYTYIVNAFLSIRNYGLRKKQNTSSLYSTIMLKNHVKIAFRFMAKNLVYTGLNVLGLTLGMLSCLYILMYVGFETSYEHFHENAERIARVSVDVYNEGKLDVQDAMSYPSVGPDLKEKFPVVEEYVHFYPTDGVEFAVDNEVFKAGNFFFTENSCFKVFSYEFLYGDKETALQNPFELVLTERAAEKYFGKKNVIGRSILINGQIELKVVGVIKNVPPNSHITFDMLLSYPTGIRLQGWDVTSWNMNNEYTYLLLSSSEDFERFEEDLQSYVLALQEKGILEAENLVAQRLTDIHLYSDKTYEIEANGDARSVYFLGVIGLFIIFLAGINYINLFLAKSLERAKEVGVRKVIGSNRNQLIGQFLTETALINLLSAVLAVGLLKLLLPFFYELSGIPEQASFFSQPILWLFLIGLTVLSILFSGIYPSTILSHFSPISVLKGKYTHNKQGIWFRKGLVVFQFAISIMLMIGAFVVGKQLIHLQKTDLGMNIDQTIVVEAPFTDSLKENRGAFRNSLTNIASVKEVSHTGGVPGYVDITTTTGIQMKGSGKKNNFTYNLYQIDEHFIHLMGIELIAGGNLQAGDQKLYKLLVNEETLRLWDITPQEAVGKVVQFWGIDWIIQGVIKNFYQRSPKEPHIPMILYSYDFKYSWYFTSISLQSTDLAQSIANIQQVWKTHFPESVFQYFFLDEKFNQQYSQDQKFSTLFRYATFLAIFIACLGLVGISIYNTQQRAKEIGIRKVLGAGIPHIVSLLMKSYLSLIAISIILAIPLSFLGVRNWLENFATKINLDMGIFITPVLLVLGFAILAVSWQTIRLAFINPIQTLKDE